MIPVLETNRLVLRGYRPADFADYSARRADPSYARFLGDGTPSNEEQSWASFLQIAGLWAVAGFGEWAVEERQRRVLVGGVGFILRKRDRGEALKDVLEIGYGVATTFAGNGYTTEALNAALAWGRNHLGATRRCVAIIAPGNEPSVRIAVKCAFTRGLDIISGGRPRMVYERRL
ncbi:MAG TPA: GNAT family N-acetyltransferase [Rhizomicrobium sp.]